MMTMTSVINQRPARLSASPTSTSEITHIPIDDDDREKGSKNHPNVLGGRRRCCAAVNRVFSVLVVTAFVGRVATAVVGGAVPLMKLLKNFTKVVLVMSPSLVIVFVIIRTIIRRWRNGALGVAAHRLRVRSPTDHTEGGATTGTPGMMSGIRIFDIALLFAVAAFALIDLMNTVNVGEIMSPPQRLGGAPEPVWIPVKHWRLSEDPVAIASAMDTADSGKFAKPAQCTEEEIGRVQKSGLEGSRCSGPRPHKQRCSFTKLAKNSKATYLNEFSEEIRASRITKENSESTFFGVMVEKDGGCSNIGESLGHFSTGGVSDGEISEAGKAMLKEPRLLCNSGKSLGEDFKTTWGVMRQSDLTVGLDQYLDENGMTEEIKDVVFINMGHDSDILNNGWATVARARYLKFSYDWRGSWRTDDLKPIVEKLDVLGHACYFQGEGKLWRITDCWQDFYGYKSYAHIACVNRNLAPKLAGTMEDLFKSTIS